MRKRDGAVESLCGFLLVAAAVAWRGRVSLWAGFFFFPIAAWGAVLVLDGASAAAAQEPLLLGSPEQLLGLAALSVPWCLFFECLNFRLGLWTYQGLPDSLSLRWTVYALGSAAVLPALDRARALLASLAPLDRAPLPALRLSSRSRATLRALGLVCLALALAWPGALWPLAWLAVFFWVEPVLERAASLDSVLFQLGFGNGEGLLSWLGAGLLCGALWEALDLFSGARRVYTLPLGAGPKLLDLPALGYAAYAFFALSSSSVRAWAGRSWARAGEFQRFRWVFSAAVFVAAVFIGMDALSAGPFTPFP